MCIATLSGCATFRTLDSDLPLNQRMYVYSGTRVDWSELNGNDVVARKAQITAPAYPLVDLPFSFALDSLLLPLTVFAEIFH